MCGNFGPGGSGKIGGIAVGDPLDLFGGQKRAAAKAAEAKARAEEGAKQKTIDKNVADINSAYDGRGKQYDDYLGALRQSGTQDFERQRGVAERENRFALARTGNTGGSVALDRGRDLSRAAADGAIAVERNARGGLADLQDKDETARMNLIQLANSGGNVGNGAQQAARMMESSLSAAKNGAATQGLGDLFAGASNYARTSRDRAEYLRGVRSTSPYGAAPAASGVSGPR